MKALRISIALIVLLTSCVFINSQEIAFTPNQYYFGIQENTNTSLGTVYITSNVDIIPSYTSSNELFQLTSSGLISLRESVSLDYENTTQRRETSVITESSTNVTASVIFCLIDLNDNIPTPPSPDSLTIEINTTELSVNNTIVRFNSTDADSNANGLVLF
ncbi:hypothetical protein LOD99_10216, partial [Oopsacas minuta]